MPKKLDTSLVNGIGALSPPLFCGISDISKKEESFLLKSLNDKKILFASSSVIVPTVIQLFSDLSEALKMIYCGKQSTFVLPFMSEKDQRDIYDKNNLLENREIEKKREKSFFKFLFYIRDDICFDKFTGEGRVYYDVKECLNERETITINGGKQKYRKVFICCDSLNESCLTDESLLLRISEMDDVHFIVNATQCGRKVERNPLVYKYSKQFPHLFTFFINKKSSSQIGVSGCIFMGDEILVTYLKYSLRGLVFSAQTPPIFSHVSCWDNFFE